MVHFNVNSLPGIFIYLRYKLSTLFLSCVQIYNVKKRVLSF